MKMAYIEFDLTLTGPDRLMASVDAVGFHTGEPLGGEAKERKGASMLITSLSMTANGEGSKTGLPQDMLVKCPKCRALRYRREWEKDLKVCRECGHHFRLSAPERIALLLDPGTFIEIDAHLRPADPLRFVCRAQSYAARLAEVQKDTGLSEAVVSGSGCIEGHALALAVMDFRFIGGSMGSVVGEKVTRATDLALERGLPLLIVSASGGARMHEGIFSLMQMAKTSAALARLSEARLPRLSLLTDPTAGGVTASFAMQAEIILAEPGALIGFAGPRVIEQFMHQKLPADADTSEFMLEHGMIDAIVHRRLLRATLARILQLYESRTSMKGGSFRPRPSGLTSDPSVVDLEKEVGKPQCNGGCLEVEGRLQIREAEAACQSSRQYPRYLLSCWDRVQLARHQERPHTADYIRLMCDDFFELRGDRRYGDDRAVLGGLATFAGQTIMLIGHQKGRSLAEKQVCNFGMPMPEGYRKTQRLMRHAERFGFPVVCLLDTPGAYPGLESEQRGIAQAIAENLEVMATLRVQTVAIVMGEGGSGGALALGLADRVLMLEHAIYTVAAPEAAASIVWRDSAFAPEAAEAMRITAQDLLELGVIDGIIQEPPGGAHSHHCAAAQLLGERLCLVLAELVEIPVAELLKRRYARFRCIGRFC